MTALGAVIACVLLVSPTAQATEASVLQAAITIDSLAASGSAFCIGPHRLLSAAHVTEGNAVMQGTSADGRDRFAVSVVREDAAHDLALLHVEEPCARVLDLAESLPPIGATVHAVGSPIGAPVLSEGTLRSTGPLELVAEIAVAPGSSGGPLLGPDDTVIGVVVKRDEIGNAYAVPIAVVRSFLDRAEDAPTPTATPTPAAVTPQDGTPTLIVAVIALFVAFAALIISVWSLLASRSRRRPIVITLEEEH